MEENEGHFGSTDCKNNVFSWARKACVWWNSPSAQESSNGSPLLLGITHRVLDLGMIPRAPVSPSSSCHTQLQPGSPFPLLSQPASDCLRVHARPLFFSSIFTPSLLIPFQFSASVPPPRGTFRGLPWCPPPRGRMVILLLGFITWTQFTWSNDLFVGGFVSLCARSPASSSRLCPPL